ncbi:MAG: hypothetical protein AAF821_14390 [Cyanobacteria bacterium P01_D01_bin.156]
MMQTEFEFCLPTGYVDDFGQVHQVGIMRRSRAMDEILPLQDPRVQANPAYASIIILTRVIVSLGDLPEVTPQVLENMFASDLGYLQTLYRQINSPAILTEADISAESITDIENALTQELVAATS